MRRAALAAGRMHRVWMASGLFVGGLLIAGVWGWFGPGAAGVHAAPSPENGPYIVLHYPRVIDGDSLDGYIDGRRVAVGYRGVAAPTQRAACGREAEQKNRELIGNRVLLQDPPGGPEYDRLGRRMYYVYTEDRRSVDEALARSGVARARTDSHYRTFMESVETEARTARRGCLWGR
jgi:endonuclease YncB( thermonuclease family)